MKQAHAHLAGSVAAILLLTLLVTLPAVAATGGHPASAPSPRLPAAAPTTVSAIWVWTSFPGQGNFLYVPANSTGVLVYPTWHLNLVSSTNASYTVYDGGLELASGTVRGTAVAVFNVTGPTVTVLVGFSGVTYQYRNEVVASTPVQTASPPPPLAYTVQQFTAALLAVQVQVYAVVLLAFLGSFFMARKIVILNSKSRATRVL